MNKIIAIAILFMGCPQAVPAVQPKAPEGFVRELVKAINARDINTLTPFIAEPTRACMTPDKADYYGWWLWKDGASRYHITAPYTTRLDPPLDVKAVEKAMSQAAFTPTHWPLQPDAALHISYHPAPMSIIERVFQVSLKGGEAKLVMDCPTKLGLEQLQKKRAALVTQQKKLAILWKQLGPQEQQSYTVMARNGMKLEGMKAVESKYHLNSDDSLAFMDMVEYANTP